MGTGVGVRRATEVSSPSQRDKGMVGELLKAKKIESVQTYVGWLVF